MLIRPLLRRTALIVVLGLAPPTATWADPPAHAPAHGYRAQHRYVYYPEREIYYSPESRLWFWMDGGDWRFGVSLPVIYQQYTSGGISIELGSERPYTEHVHVVERYGKGPRHSSRGSSRPQGTGKPRESGQRPAEKHHAGHDKRDGQGGRKDSHGDRH